MPWNLDDDGSPAAAPAAPAARPATIFDEPDARPDPKSSDERLTRLEKKLNGALYLLRRADAARRNRRAGIALLFLAGISAVGYAYWPQLRDADWGAARDLAVQGAQAFRERRLGDFLTARFGDTALGRALVSQASDADAASAREARHRQQAAAPVPAAPAAPSAPAVPAPEASGASAADSGAAAPTLPAPRPRRP